MDAGIIERLWNAVNRLSGQPRGAVAVLVWACLWSETDLTDFRVKADRQWIAAKAGTTVRQVSRVLTMLEQIGAIRREHERHVRGQRRWLRTNSHPHLIRMGKALRHGFRMFGRKAVRC